MKHIHTVLGSITEEELGIVLPHEHICCYSEYLLQMAGKQYLDKARLCEVSVSYLRELKEKYGLTTFIDCTPVNIGRDMELLKKVSEKSGVNIICSTGFYFTDEPLLHQIEPDLIADFMVADAKNINAGIIKCAVEEETVSAYHEKILRASAKAHKLLNLPIVVHTDAPLQNGEKALEILFSEGVAPEAITIGHLSDSEDPEYVKRIASSGCFLGFDRLYNRPTQEYISQKVQSIQQLFEAGFEDQVLLSHDALFFNGFATDLTINEKPRFSYCFDHILPAFSEDMVDKVMKQNPLRMLKCGK